MASTSLKLFLICCVCWSFNSFAVQASTPDVNDVTTFEHFKVTFGKEYSDLENEQIHRENFYNSLRKIEEMKKKFPNLDFGVNEHSDLSPEEYADLFPASHGKRIVDENLNQNQEFFSNDKTSTKKLPKEHDWRDKITLSPVKTQGTQCGACWTFSTTVAVEAQYAIKNRKQNLVLSKQEIVDCSEKEFDHSYRNHGCYFGFDVDAYKYMMKEGVMEESYYPYTGTFNETCMAKKIPAPIKYKIDNYKIMSYNVSDASIMQLLVEHGPVTVDILATHDVFRFYKGGILRYTFPNSVQTNHAVLLVGYGHYEPLNIDYWILRNSWGSTWGENGYARIERGYDQMGLNNYVSYPILN